jgi:predicted DNA binding CopG/RHH family protein
MKKSTIPKFTSYKEEAKFWDSRDTTEYLDELEAAKLEFPKPRKKLVSIRLPEPEIIGLKRIAARKGVGYLTLIRMWTTERFFKELKSI